MSTNFLQSLSATSYIFKFSKTNPIRAIPFYIPLSSFLHATVVRGFPSSFFWGVSPFLPFLLFCSTGFRSFLVETARLDMVAATNR